MSNKIEAEEVDFLYVKPSQISNAGQGLYTAVKIYKDEVIAIYNGEIIGPREVQKRIEQNADQYFITRLDGKILDSKNVECFAKYANDAQALPNKHLKNNAYIGIGSRNKICLIAKKNIQAGEEIFCSYGASYWRKHKKNLIDTIANNN